MLEHEGEIYHNYGSVKAYSKLNLIKHSEQTLLITVIRTEKAKVI